MSSAGKIAIEEEKKTCEMLIELHPLIEVEQEHLSIQPHTAAVRDVKKLLVSNTSCLCTVLSPNHFSTGQNKKIQALSRLRAICSKWAAGCMIDCLIHSVWGCLRRRLQVYNCSVWSIFLSDASLASNAALLSSFPLLAFTSLSSWKGRSTMGARLPWPLTPHQGFWREGEKEEVTINLSTCPLLQSRW